jgi:hypothetical protein
MNTFPCLLDKIVDKTHKIKIRNKNIIKFITYINYKMVIFIFQLNSDFS